MRRYDEAIDVRRGLVSGQEAPTQFIWRDRVWVVRLIIAHWIETGAWWEQPGVGVLFGDSGAGRAIDLLGEEELWRVEAAPGRASAGVFDLSFHWALGQWRLVGCID